MPFYPRGQIFLTIKFLPTKFQKDQLKNAFPSDTRASLFGTFWGADLFSHWLDPFLAHFIRLAPGDTQFLSWPLENWAENVKQLVSLTDLLLCVGNGPRLDNARFCARFWEYLGTIFWKPHVNYRMLKIDASIEIHSAFKWNFSILLQILFIFGNRKCYFWDNFLLNSILHKIFTWKP